MNYTIEPLDKENIQNATELCVLCFGENWREIASTDFPSCFADYPYKPHTFVAKKEGYLIGLCMIAPVIITPDTFSIAWLCTHPDHRKQSIAKNLVDACENYAIENLALFDNAMFMLASAIKPSYYEGLGYKNIAMTHRDDPLMVKYYKSADK